MKIEDTLTLMGLVNQSNVQDAAVTDAVKALAKRLTFALIKPDAVAAGNAGAILSMMERHFTVTDVICSRWSKSLVREFYADHCERPWFPELVDFMISDRMYAVVLVSKDGDDAVSLWRDLIGATDPRKAEPHTVRGRFGDKNGVIMRNAVHGSDSADNAVREIDIVHTRISDSFGEVAVEPISQMLDMPLLGAS